MFCPHCGSMIPDGSHFCSECGQSIEIGTPQAQDPIYDQDQGQAQQYVPQPEVQQTYDIQPAAPAAGSYSAQTASPNRMRTDRDIVTYVLLSIVTCGIYSYYYIYEMSRDVNVMCADDGEETPGLAAFILLSIVTCGIYSYYWIYKIGNRVQQNGPRYGVTIADGGSDVLLWLVLGAFTCGICAYIGMHLLIKSINTLSTAYNNTYGLG